MMNNFAGHLVVLVNSFKEKTGDDQGQPKSGSWGGTWSAEAI